MMLLAASLALSACAMTLPAGGHRPLSRFERDAGWVQLFDGAQPSGWRGIGKDAFPAMGWEIVGGCLHRKPGERGGDIVTTAEFGDFELEFEWKVAPGANSGLKYRVRDEPGQGSAFGPEYQVLDDGAHENGLSPKTSAGALYAVMAAQKSAPPRVGEFNQGRIVCYAGRIEHWLNGERLFDVELDGQTWAENMGASKFKARADFASPGPGRIVLQDHGDEVWFRNLRLRELPAWGASEVELYDGESLEHWYEYGDAIYEADGDSILGRIGGGGQSFLITKEHFGDFVMEVDVKTELPGNSGIQIRSHEKENEQPFGYQIEIDSSPRAWSGGLFDEARRGWLQNLEKNPEGRAAFRYQEWNRFRIECVGPWIKTWVNGVPVTDYFDTADLEGFIALQVHSGNNTRVRWRNPRLWDLGRRSWLSLHDGASLDGWRAELGEWSSQDGSIVAQTAQGGDSILGLVNDAADEFLSEGRLTIALSIRIDAEEDCEEGSVRLVAVGRGTGGHEVSTFDLTPRERSQWGKWNDVSIGLVANRVVTTMNGRLQEDVTLPANRVMGGKPLSIHIEGGPMTVRLRDLHLLGDPVPRDAPNK